MGPARAVLPIFNYVLTTVGGLLWTLDKTEDCRPCIVVGYGTNEPRKKVQVDYIIKFRNKIFTDIEALEESPVKHTRVARNMVLEWDRAILALCGPIPDKKNSNKYIAEFLYEFYLKHLDTARKQLQQLLKDKLGHTMRAPAKGLAKTRRLKRTKITDTGKSNMLTSASKDAASPDDDDDDDVNSGLFVTPYPTKDALAIKLRRQMLWEKAQQANKVSKGTGFVAGADVSTDDEGESDDDVSTDDDDESDEGDECDGDDDTAEPVASTDNDGNTVGSVLVTDASTGKAGSDNNPHTPGPCRTQSSASAYRHRPY